MPRPDVFSQALRALDAGRGVAIACVIGAHGSTPRHLGARMAVADDGEQWGTVGGGRIEQLVVGAAREVAGGAAPRVVRQHLVRDLAMCCGGSMEVVVTPGAGSRDAIDTAVGSSRANSIAQLGPDSTATPTAGPHSCSMTSDMRNSVSCSSPFVALTTVDPWRMCGAARRKTSREPCDGTAATTSSLTASASARSRVTRRFGGKRISGR